MPMFEVPCTRSEERNEFRRRADEKLSVVAPKCRSRWGAPSSLSPVSPITGANALPSVFCECGGGVVRLLFRFRSAFPEFHGAVPGGARQSCPIGREGNHTNPARMSL